MDTDGHLKRTKQKQKKNSGFKGKIFREYVCPNCKKRRMLREEGHVVSIDKHTTSLPDGSELEHFVDVCDACARKIQRMLVSKSRKAQMKRVLKALSSNEDLGDKSLEDLL